MKVLEFIQSLIVPKYMGARKNMNIFISIGILIVCALVLSVPISTKISKQRYDVYDTFNFDIIDYVDDANLNAYPFTQEELDTYNMTTYADFKELGAYISLTGGIENADKIENGKEYVLKSVKPVYDDEGTIKDYKIYYVHIVFDMEDESAYDISENFDKLKKDEDGTFAHFLIVFYQKSFTYRSIYEIENGESASQISYYKNIIISLKDTESLTDVSHSLIDMMIPLNQFNYRIRAMLFVALFPLLIAMIFSFVLKNGQELSTTKHFISIASVSSIMLTIACFAFSWMSNAICSIIIQWYSVFFAIYYYIVIIIVNRRPRVEKEDTKLSLKNS